jgi:radical SAM protein with 4Fe4S-binding SPASM domain
MMTEENSLKKQTGTENEDVIIYGTGSYAEKLCEYYGDSVLKKEVKAFVVTDKEHKTSFHGIQILSADELENPEQYVAIIAMAKDTRESVENAIWMKFKRIVCLEEFMSMVYFLQENGSDRNQAVSDYYDSFCENPQLPQYIEIETINRCNGECRFCPVNRFEKQRQFAQMPEHLFFKIIDELKSIGYKGHLALFSNNEPFLDNRITKFAQYAKKSLPEAYVYLDSNGTVLTLDKFKEIIPLLDGLNLDIYKDNLENEDPDNINQILEYARENDYIKKMKISRIDRNAVRSSRGGKSPNSAVDFTIRDKCPLLLIQMVIRPDGKVSLCCNDALGTFTLGNVNDESICAIWNGDIYKDLRKKLNHSRADISLCQYCDYIDMRQL